MIDGESNKKWNKARDQLQARADKYELLWRRAQMELERAHGALRHKKVANKKLHARLLATIQQRDEALASDSPTPPAEGVGKT